MKEFKSLNPQKLPDDYDFRVHTEQPIVEVVELKGKIELSYKFPGFYLTDVENEIEEESKDMNQISIQSTGFFTESGKPLLPSFGRYVQIPQNSKYQISVKKSDPVIFEDILVTPAQTQMSDNPNQKHKFEYDRDFYTKDLMYPDEIVKVTGPFMLDQYHALLIHVTPLQYNPKKKQITGYGNIEIDIELSEEKHSDVEFNPIFRSNNEGFGNLLLNPGQRIYEKVGFDVPPVMIRDSGAQLLIIYAKIFEKAALKLADWKNHKGTITECVCVDVIGNTVDKLKAFIRAKRGGINSCLRYVLLFGDSDMIVTQTNLNSIYGAAGFPSHPHFTATDYYYSTKYDSDTPDPQKPNAKLFFPWLSIGRIPVRPDVEGPIASGDSKAQGIVDQIINYEKNPPADPNYYKRMVFAAFFQGANHKDTRGYLTTIEYLYSQMKALGYNAERVYVSNDPNPQFFQDGTPIPNDVKAAIISDENIATRKLIDYTNAGQLCIAHRDHGNWDGWYKPPFKVSDLDRITGDMPSIFYSINCETGGFDYPKPTECWAEKNLRIRGGAPSLVAATRDSGTYRNNELIKAIFDASFGGVLPTFPGGNASYPVRNNCLGDILNYAKSYLPVIFSSDEDGVKDHFEIYHVIGDPSMELWKEQPKRISITASIIKNSLDIHLSSCPAGTIITLWFTTRLLKRMEVNTNHISIPITGLIKIPMIPTIKPIPPKPIFKISLWAPGYHYKSINVPIPLSYAKVKETVHEHMETH